MTTLFAALIGFLSAAFPEAMKLWRDKADRAHELAVLDRQMELHRLGLSERLAMVDAVADMHTSTALYGTVRPVLAYAFFALYAAVKLAQLQLAAAATGGSLLLALPLLWTADDQAIFAGIIAFYFGQRAMRKLGGG